MKTGWWVIGVVLVLAILAFGAVAWADTHYVDPGGSNTPPYTTPETAAHSIQDAINVATAGDTVDVADGTYTITSKILVDKGVTITGNVGNPENVVVQYSPAANSLMFDMRASNATIQGIKVTGGKAGFWFDQSAVTGCTISNCIVDSVGEYGIYMKNGGSGHTIDSCTISNTGQTYAGAPAVLIENCLDVTVSNNTLSSISDKGVYVRVCNAGSVGDRVEVTGNSISGCAYSCIQVYQSPYTYIYDNTITSTSDKGLNIIGPNASSQAARVILEGNNISGCPWGGILLTHDRYTYIYNNTISTDDKGISIANGENVTSSAERIIVEGNNVSGTKYPGIQVAYAVPYTYIHNNALSGCNYYGADGSGDWDYASIHVAEDCGNTIVDGNDISDGINGVQIWSDNCTVTNNVVYNMGLTYADTKGTGDGTYYNSGIIIGSNWLTNNLKPTGTTIADNNIHDNHWGLYVRDYATLSPGDPSVLNVTAEKNWWGAADGPSHSPGSGDKVSVNVDYSPWLGATPETSPMTWGTDDSIQDAIDAATAGDTINVYDGTYQEAITIDKSLTLKAASKPVIDCSDRAALELAKADGCIEVTADNVTIQGFKLIGYDPTGESWSDQKSSSNYATIKVTSGADGLKVKDNEFTGTSKAAVGLLVDDDCDDVEFTGNTVTDYLQGVVGHKNVDNLLVEDNEFTIPIVENTGLAHDEAYGYGVQLWHGNNLQVINNTFTGSWDTATGDYEDPDSLCNHYAVSTFTTYFASAFGWPDIVGDIHIKDNEMTNLYLGIGSFAGGGEVEDNIIYDNLLGIQLGQVSGTWATAPTAGLSITGNDIENNKRGIWAQSFVPDGIAAHFNNIVGNTEYGVINEDPENDVFDATNNWWGDGSGPTHATNLGGTGDAVSDNVLYYPWTGAETTEVSTNPIEEGTPIAAGATATGIGEISMTGTGNPDVTTAKYKNNPGGTALGNATGNYWDVHLDNAAGVNSLTVHFCPSNARTIISYWDVLSVSWQRCSNQVFNAATNCVEVTISNGPPATQPTLAELAGLAFGSGTAAGGGGPSLPRPEAEAGEDQTVTVGHVVQLDGSASESRDSSSDWVGYDWSLVVKPTGSRAMLSDSNTVNPTFVPDVPGRYVIALVVTNHSSKTDYDDVTITALEADNTLILPAGWHMIAVPLVLEDDTPAGVFADVDPLRLYCYNGQTYDSCQAGTLTAVCCMHGYWICLGELMELHFQGDPLTGEQVLPLERTGWHMIGVPYPVSWGNDGSVTVAKYGETKSLAEAAAAGWIDERIWMYSAITGAYQAIGIEAGLILDPWVGYWVQTHVSGLVLHFTPSGAAVNTGFAREEVLWRVCTGTMGNPPPPPTLSLREILEGFAFTVSPNPVVDVNTTYFEVEGAAAYLVEALKVRIYDLSGRLVYEAEEAGASLAWHTDNIDGEYLANGVYLYKLYALFDGQWVVSTVKNVVILR